MTEDQAAAIIRGAVPAIRQHIEKSSQAASDALTRTIDAIVREAAVAEELRAAEFRAFLAEQREALGAMQRAVEARLAEVKDGRDGQDGNDAAPIDPADIARMVDAAVIARGALDTSVLIETVERDFAAHKDAVSTDLDERIGFAVEQRVAAAIAEIPLAERGDPGEPGAPGTDGKDADPAVVEGMVSRSIAAALPDALERALAALPSAERGEKGESGERGPAGLGIADLLQDHEGCLIATFEDGRMKNIGRIKGEKGDPGEPGRDGISLEDVRAVQDGDLLTLEFQHGEARDAFDIRLPRGPEGEKGDRGDPGPDGQPGPPGEAGRDAYPGKACGLYDPSAEYRALDWVTLNGSAWLAKCDNPGSLPGDDWMVGAKRGDTGRTGPAGPEGPSGKPGADGASLIGGKVDCQKMAMDLISEDGETVTVDLLEFAETIRDANK